MDQLTDWLSLTVRWLHVIFGVAWIGTSFYFNWLNNSFRPVEAGPVDAGVEGEVWSVHGGKFYRVLKYGVAPAQLPKVLHWFKWEAYLTWISGFTLLALVYYVDSKVFLIDKQVRILEPWQAIGIGIGTLIVSWFVYDLLCKSPLKRKPVAFVIIAFALATAMAYGLTQVFGSRGAYIHVGAALGTMMAANVFRVIIPNQKITVDALVAGREPDPKYGQEAALRSLHNNYITLPVLFIMVSNHYPFTFGHEYNWAILAGLSLIGAGVRHFFNLQGQGERNVWILPVAAVGMVALALVTRPTSYADHEPVAFSEVRQIIESRCLACHSATPTHEVFKVAPQGVMFDTPNEIQTRAAQINTQVVVTKQMPLGNLTEISDRERDLIGAWYYQGAKVD